MKILTVEDDNMIREGISEYLFQNLDILLFKLKMEEKLCQNLIAI